jgi:hypothetical protein
MPKMLALHCGKCGEEKPLVAECEGCGDMFCDQCVEGGCPDCDEEAEGDSDDCGLDDE